MKLRAHPRYSQFKAWFIERAADTIAVAGEFYRVAGPGHTTADEIVEGMGAFKGGGRWNPPRVMNVVYLSREPETAMHEANEHRRYYGLPVWGAMPKVTVAVRVEADSILDLTNPAISADLPEPMANLLSEDWRAIMERAEEPTTQAMGRAAFKAGLKGLMVASKPDPAGVNLVVFPDVLVGKDVLEVLNPQALKKRGKRA